MKNTDVVIIGGGVAGLACANALAYVGVRSIVIEKSKKPGKVDRGDVIHQSLINTFAKWGILELFESYLPKRFKEFQILNNQGKRIFHIDLGDEFNNKTRFTVLKHPDIECFLEDAAKKSGKVVLLRGENCTDLMFDGIRITGAITNKSRYRAPLVIIANGAKSVIRNRYFGKPKRQEYNVSFYNGCFDLIPKFEKSGYYVLGKKGVLIIVPLPNNQMRIGVQFKKGEKVSSKNIKEIVSKRLNFLTKNELNFISGHIYPIYSSLCESWFIPGSILLGDAAHTVHPVGGQGMNLAFKDADVLAELIGKNGLEKACSLYEKRRKKEVKLVLKRTHIMGIMGSIDYPFYIGVREKLLMIANKLPYVKKKIFERIIHIN